MINRRDDKDRIKDGSLSLIYLPYRRLYPDTYIAIVLFYQVVPVQADRRPIPCATPEYSEYSDLFCVYSYSEYSVQARSNRKVSSPIIQHVNLVSVHCIHSSTNYSLELALTRLMTSYLAFNNLFHHSDWTEYSYSEYSLLW
jgi:hypothetical protein